MRRLLLLCLLVALFIPRGAPAADVPPRAEAAGVSAAIRASPSTVDPGQQILYTLYFNNTGPDAAGVAWVNLSLAAGLEWVSDTNGSAGGTWLGPGMWRFAPVNPGPHSFAVTVRLEDSPVPGTALTTTVSVDYAELTGGPGPSSAASATTLVSLKWKPLYFASPDALQPRAPTGAQATAVLTTTGNTRTYTWALATPLTRPLRLDGTVRLLLFLDDSPPASNLPVVFSLLWGSNGSVIQSKEVPVALDAGVGAQLWSLDLPPSGHAIPAGDALLLRLRNNLGGGPGPSLTVHYNATAAPSRVLLQTSAYVRVESLAVQGPRGNATQFTVLDSLAAVARVADPFTASEIVGARARVTASGGALLVDAPMVAVGTDPSVPAAWRDFRLPLGALPLVGDYVLQVTATEASGVTHTALASFAVVSPRVVAAKTVNATVAEPGQRLEYRLWMNNTGNTPASVWVNDTLPVDVVYDGDTSASAGGTMLGPGSWFFAAVFPGSHSFLLWGLVNASLTTGFLENRVTMDYSDANDVVYPRTEARAFTVIDSPYLAVTKAASLADLYRGAAVDYTITVTNVGARDATNVTVTDALPAPLVLLGTTPPGTVSGSNVTWSVPLLATNASLTYVVHALVSETAADGELVVNAVTAAYAHPDGTPMPPSTASVTSLVRAPILRVSAAFDPPFAEGGTAVAFEISVENQGGAPTAYAWVNLTLPGDLDLLSVSGPWSYDPFLRRLTWTLAALGAGTGVPLQASLQVGAGLHDGETLELAATTDYTGPTGRFLYNASAESADLTVLAPSLALAAGISAFGVDGGETFSLTFYLNNTGSVSAPLAWLNLSLPPGLVIVAALPAPTALESWRLVDIPLGDAEASHSVTVTVAVSALDFADGDWVNGTAHLRYADRAGGVLQPPSLVAAQRIASPRLVVSLAPRASEDAYRVVLDVVVENSGSRAASLAWVNLTLPAGLEHFADDFPVPVVQSDGSLSWKLQEVGVGTATYSVTLKVLGSGETTVALYATVDATNSLGLGQASSKSNTAVLQVQGFPWQVPFLGIAVTLLLLYFVYRRMMPDVVEIFLVHRNGMLIHHLSPETDKDRDPDILSGMLTAVQDFVHDAFVYGEKKRPLQRMDFGEYSILLRRGKTVYLAAVIRGRDTPRLREMLEANVAGLEDRFGKVLRDWGGDEADVIPVREYLSAQLLGVHRVRLTAQ
ncbi:MAG TPA: DUF11 domain-containing protein [Thermoplasmata archaeon]|nr:DUF11 domain-containing protein [Thermoplasmata archaeon]